MASMKAVGVATYGPVDNFQSRDIPKPGEPTGRDVLVKEVLNPQSFYLSNNIDRVKACSVNPIDTKIRGGTYDDAPDYYEHAPQGFHVIGYDGAGTVLEVGPDVTRFKVGDDISWVGATTRQGSYAEYQLVSEVLCCKKPENLDFVEAASYGLTFGTAYQSLNHRLKIKPNEDAGILIINGGGGVGSAAIQLARNVLQLPVVVATASRPDTAASCKRMGATHVVNHRKDLVEEIKALKLDVPIKLYGTDFMSKSMTLSWDWLGTAAFHHSNVESYHEIFKTLGNLMSGGKLFPTLNQRYKLTLENLKQAHRQIESKATIGKIGLGVEEPGEGTPFA
ncbi:unnamed protein product [Alternaria alternata]